MAKPKPPKFNEEWRASVRMCTDVFLPEDRLEVVADIALAEDPLNALVGLSQATGPRMGIDQHIALITGKKWANGRTLRVGFMGGTKAQQEFVAKTAAVWSQYANLIFQFGTPVTQSEIRITFDASKGAWSYMGVDCAAIAKNQATMNLGWLDVAVVLHEFGHALAAIHEHQHPEAGIPWNRQAVYAYYGGPPNNWDRRTIDSNIFGSYAKDQTQFSEYDPTSIMHYATDAKLLTDPSRATGWNKVLSTMDMTFIGAVYPKPGVPPPSGGVTLTLSEALPAGTYAVTPQ